MEDSDTTKVVIKAALYALEMKPPDTDGNKDEISLEVVGMLPPNAKIFAAACLKWGFPPVALSHSVQNHYRALEIRDEIMTGLSELDHSNNAITVYT